MRHQHISFFKSTFRIAGYVLLWQVAPPAALVLVMSEVIGIVEEIGHD